MADSTMNNLVTYAEAGERAHTGRNLTMRIAKESGALIKIGRKALVQWDVFYQYIVDNFQA